MGNVFEKESCSDEHTSDLSTEHSFILKRLSSTYFDEQELSSAYPTLPAFESTVIELLGSARNINARPVVTDKMLFRVFASQYAKSTARLDIKDSLDKYLESDAAFKAHESINKVKLRLLLRVQIAYHRHANKLKQDMEYDSSHPDTMRASKYLFSIPSSSATTHGVKNSIAHVETQPIVSSTDLLLSTSITLSMSILAGLKGSPMYFTSFQFICMNMLSMLSSTIPQLVPFPSQSEQTISKADILLEPLLTWPNNLPSHATLSESCSSVTITSDEHDTTHLFIEPNTKVCFLSIAIGGNQTSYKLLFGLFKKLSSTLALSSDQYTPVAVLNQKGEYILQNSCLYTSRSVKPGDILCIEVNLFENWCEISNVGIEKSLYRFTLTSLTGGVEKLVCGLQVIGTQFIRIIPHNRVAMNKILTIKHECANGHEMTACRTIHDTSYSVAAHVNCDACSRRSIHVDSLPFHHCGICHHDLCAACVLKNIPNSSISITTSLKSTSLLDTSDMTSPFKPDSMQWTALDLIIEACRSILSDSTLSESNSDLLEWALSLLFVIAVLRHSLGGVLECTGIIQEKGIGLKLETSAFLAYLTGNANVLETAPVSVESVQISTISNIMKSLNHLSSFGYFSLRTKEELQMITSMLEQGLVLCEKATNIHNCDVIYSSALGIIKNCFSIIFTQLSPYSAQLQEFKSSSAYMSILNILNHVISSTTLSNYTALSKTAIQLKALFIEQLCSSLDERIGTMLSLLRKLESSEINTSELSLLSILLNDLDAVKLQVLVVFQVSKYGHSSVLCTLSTVYAELFILSVNMFMKDLALHNTQYSNVCIATYSALEILTLFIVHYICTILHGKNTENTEIMQQEAITVFFSTLELIISKSSEIIENIMQISNNNQIIRLALTSNHVCNLVPFALYACAIILKQFSQYVNSNVISTFFNLLLEFSIIIKKCTKYLQLDSELSDLLTQTCGANMLVRQDSPTQSMSWSRELSNPELGIHDSNTRVVRLGNVSCYPAAFSPFLTSKFRFVCVLNSADSSSNWLTIGLCKSDFPKSNSDGIGRSSGSWGIADDRSSSSSATFYSSGDIVCSAPRKLQLGDKITITGDTDSGWVEVEISGQSDTFAQKFHFITEAGVTLVVGATLANDHQLTILPSEVLAPLVITSALPKGASSWLSYIVSEMSDLLSDLVKYFSHSTSTLEISEKWLNCRCFHPQHTTSDNVKYKTDVRSAFVSDIFESSSPRATRLRQRMYALATSDSGQPRTLNSHVLSPSVSPLLACILWHCCLIDEGIALSVEEDVSLAHFTSLQQVWLWISSPKIRQLLQDVSEEDIVWRSNALIDYSPLCSTFDSAVCANLLEFILHGPTSKADMDTVLLVIEARVNSHIKGVTAACTLLTSTDSERSKGMILRSLFSAFQLSQSYISVEKRGQTTDLLLELETCKFKLLDICIHDCITSLKALNISTTSEAVSESVICILASYMAMVYDLSPANVLFMESKGLMHLLESGFKCFSGTIRSATCDLLEVICYCLLDDSSSPGSTVKPYISTVVQQIHSDSTLVRVKNGDSIPIGPNSASGGNGGGSVCILQGSYACTPKEPGLIHPVTLPSSHSASFWLYVPTLERNNGTVFIKGVESSKVAWSYLSVSLIDNRLVLHLHGGSAEGVTLQSTLQSQVWVHVTYVIDVINKEFTCFVNGKISASHSLDPAVVSKDDFNSSPLILGQSSSFFTKNRSCYCVLSSFFMYKSCLTIQEIDGIYRFNGELFYSSNIFKSNQKTRTAYIALPSVDSCYYITGSGPLSVGLLLQSTRMNNCVFGVESNSIGFTHSSDMSKLLFQNEKKYELFIEKPVTECILLFSVEKRSLTFRFTMDRNVRLSVDGPDAGEIVVAIPLLEYDEYAIGVTCLIANESIQIVQDLPENSLNQPFEWDIGYNLLKNPVNHKYTDEHAHFDTIYHIGLLSQVLLHPKILVEQTSISHAVEKIWRVACTSSSCMVRLAANRCFAKILPRLNLMVLGSLNNDVFSFTVPEQSADSGFTFIYSLVLLLGRAINPYSQHFNEASTTSCPGYISTFEYIDLLQHLFTYARTEEWTKAVHKVLSLILTNTSTTLSLLTDHRQKGPSLAFLTSDSLNVLIGLLGITSGFSVGNLPGNEFIHKRTNFSIGEPSIILGYADDCEVFEDLLRVSPVDTYPPDSVDVFNTSAIQSRDAHTLPELLLNSIELISKPFLELLSTCIHLTTIDPRPPIRRESSIKKAVVLEFESPHPYRDNTDESWEICIPGAEEMIIQFDPKTKTESNYDYLKFFKDPNQATVIGDDKYSGSTSWPGVDGYPPLIIKSGICYALFHSDGSNNEWGYKFTVRATVEVPSPQPFHDAIPSLVVSRLVKGCALETTSLILKSNPSILPPDWCSSVVLPIVLQEIAYPTLMSSDSKSQYQLSTVPTADYRLFEYIHRVWTGCYRTSSADKLLGQIEDDSDVLVENSITQEGSFEDRYKQLQQAHQLGKVTTDFKYDQYLTVRPLPPQILYSLSGSSHAMYHFTTADTTATDPSQSNNDVSYLPTSLFRLRCTNGITHCRIRAAPSLDATEVGELPSGSIVQFCEEVKGFYRLQDGRGYVKKVVDSILTWERFKPDGEIPVNNIDALYCKLADDIIRERSYHVLCMMFNNSPAVLSHIPTSFIESGQMAVLFKISGLGRIDSKTSLLSVAVKEAILNSLSSVQNSIVLSDLGLIMLQFVCSQLCFISQNIGNSNNTSYTDLSAESETVIIESMHEYVNNTNEKWRIFIPGAKSIEIVFDDKSCTEKNCDYVTFYADERLSKAISTKYSGKTWPGVSGVPPLVLTNVNECWVNLTSDGSNTEWGFKLTAIPYIPPFKESELDFTNASTDTGSSVVEVVSKPSLGLAIDVYMLILQSQNTRNSLFTTHISEVLLSEMSACLAVLHLFHPKIIEMFLNAIACTIRHALEIVNMHTIVRQKLIYLCSNVIKLSTSGSGSKRGDSSRSASVLYQALTQATVYAYLFLERRGHTPQQYTSHDSLILGPSFASLFKAGSCKSLFASFERSTEGAMAVCVVERQSYKVLLGWTFDGTLIGDAGLNRRLACGFRSRDVVGVIVQRSIADEYTVTFTRNGQDVALDSSLDISALVITSTSELCIASEHVSSDHVHFYSVNDMVGSGYVCSDDRIRRSIEQNSTAGKIITSFDEVKISNIIASNDLSTLEAQRDHSRSCSRSLSEDESEYSDETSETSQLENPRAFVAINETCSIALNIVAVPSNGIGVFSFGLVESSCEQSLDVFGCMDDSWGCFIDPDEDDPDAANGRLIEGVGQGDTYFIQYNKQEGSCAVSKAEGNDPIVFAVHEPGLSPNLSFGVIFERGYIIALLDIVPPVAPVEPVSEPLLPAHRWDEALSNPDLVFSDSLTAVSRPGMVSSFPAALIPIPTSSVQFTVSVLLERSVSANNVLSFGLSDADFPSKGAQSFGERKRSWGIYNNRSSTDNLSYIAAQGDILTIFRSLQDGDVLKFECDLRAGVGILSINESELVHEFIIPTTYTYVVGATVCNDHTLRIIPDKMLSAPIESISTPSIVCSCTCIAQYEPESTVSFTHRSFNALAKVADILMAMFSGVPKFTLKYTDQILMPLCVQTFTQNRLLSVEPNTQYEYSEIFKCSGATAYSVSISFQFLTETSADINVTALAITCQDEQNDTSALDYYLTPCTLQQGGVRVDSSCASVFAVGDVVTSISVDNFGSTGDILSVSLLSGETYLRVQWRDSGAIQTFTLGDVSAGCMCSVLAGVGLKLFRRGILHYTPISPILVKGSSIKISVQLTCEIPLNIAVQVQPSLARSAVLYDEEFLGIRKSVFSRDFPFTSLLDQEIVRCIDDLRKDKSLSKEDTLRVTWETLSTSGVDLVKFPLLSMYANSNETVITQRIEEISMLNVELGKAFELLDLSQTSHSWTIARLVSLGRSLVYTGVKQHIIDMGMTKSQERGSKFDLNVSRSRAAKYTSQGLCDDNGTWTIFSQVYRKVHNMPASTLRRPDQIWETILAGERAHDLGGPYREVWSAMCEELMSASLPLLRQSPNAVNQAGEYRETYILNPEASTGTQLEMFCFLGKLIGCSARGGNCMEIYLSPFIWKLVVNEPTSFEDWRHVDMISYSWVEKMKVSTSEEFAHSYGCEELTFTVSGLGNGRIYELHIGGSGEVVTWESRLRYYNEYVAFRLSEFQYVVKALRAGLLTQLPPAVLDLVTWHEFEIMVCGNPEIEISSLTSMVEYSGCSPLDQTVVYLWEVLEEFSQEDRKAFLRFIWGRTRLPLNKKGNSFHFKIQILNKSPPDSYLPVAHTCFFSIEVPRYSTKTIMREKLRYSIYNCNVIDGDETAMGMRAAALEWEA